MANFCNQFDLSIHDLTRRSTPGQMELTEFISSFNSRPHEEVDASGRSGRRVKRLSIHDLTRRSTMVILTLRNLQHPFNSRPHEEVDLSRQKWELLQIPFNSRPHEEVDSKYLQYFVNNWLNYWLLHLKYNFFLPLYAQIFYHHFYYLLNYWCESLSISCPLHIRTRKSTFLLHQN